MELLALLKSDSLDLFSSETTDRWKQRTGERSVLL